MFDGYTWRVDEVQEALEVQRARHAVKLREYAATQRARVKSNPVKLATRREYARTHWNTYDKQRRKTDPVYLERRRKSAREAMARLYARKRGELVEIRKTGGQLPGTPHREHLCSVCGKAGHNRRRCHTRPDTSGATPLRVTTA